MNRRKIGGVKDVRLWVATLVGLLLLALAPSSDSLWIDEGMMVTLARGRSVAEILELATLLRGSESQMPFGILWFCAWGKIAGYSEWALRMGNLVPLGIGVLMLARIGRRTGAWHLPLLFAVNPLVWFYANEIRPYALQIGGGCALCLGMAMVLLDRRVSAAAAAVLGIGCLVVTGASLLGIFAAGATVAVLAVLAWRMRLRVTWGALAVTVATVLCFVGLGMYFVWSHRHAGGGVGGRDVGLEHVVFAVYENLGLGGIGPPRAMLREARAGGTEAILALLRPSLPFFALVGVLWLWLGWGIVAGLRRPASDDGGRDEVKLLFFAFLATFVVGVGLFYVAALVAGFPFYGRHLSGFSAMFIAVVSLGCVLAARVPGWRHVWLPLGVAAAWLGSSLVQRHGVQHRKEDYRSAAALALREIGQGNVVWWVATYHAGVYYGLNFRDSRLIMPQYAGLDRGSLPVPAVIVYSKPDIHDGGGRFMAYVRDNGYRLEAEFPSFQVFKKDGAGR